MRQNIDEMWKTDPRRKLLVKRLGNERLADGMRVEINWLLLDHKGGSIPFKKFQFVENFQDWIDCGLGELKGDEVHIVGADAYAEFFEKQKKNAKKPRLAKSIQKQPKLAKTSQTQPTKPSISISSSSSNSDSNSGSVGVTDPPPEAPGPDRELSRSIWKAYSDSYFTRYGTEPVRNAKVNGQVAQLAKRLGSEAPDVVRFYLGHNKSFYVSKLHDIGICLSDAEALRTQWATDTKVTSTAAGHADKSDTLREQLKRLGGNK